MVPGYSPQIGVKHLERKYFHANSNSENKIHPRKITQSLELKNEINTEDNSYRPIKQRNLNYSMIEVDNHSNKNENFKNLLNINTRENPKMNNSFSNILNNEFLYNHHPVINPQPFNIQNKYIAREYQEALKSKTTRITKNKNFFTKLAQNNIIN